MELQGDSHAPKSLWRDPRSVPTMSCPGCACRARARPSLGPALCAGAWISVAAAATCRASDVGSLRVY